MVDDNELQRDREVLNHLDDILTTWLSEIHRLEGVHRSHSLVKEEIFCFSCLYPSLYIREPLPHRYSYEKQPRDGEHIWRR